MDEKQSAEKPKTEKAQNEKTQAEKTQTEKVQAGKTQNEKFLSGKEQAEKIVQIAQQALDEKQRLLQLSEISILLDNYDDIFSDFDPRPYSVRAVSDDFLYEAKKAAKEKKPGTLDLKFMIPKEARNTSYENMIKKRLKEYFTGTYEAVKEELHKTFLKGITLTVFGIATMLIATFVLFEYGEKGLLTAFLVVLLEPAGWFLFWEGLDLAVFESKKITPELEFNKKMSNCNIQFIPF